MNKRPALKFFNDSEKAQQHDERCNMIEKHIRLHLGNVEDIFCQELPGSGAIEVMLVEPSASRDYYTLVTAGASSHKFPIHVDGTHTECDSDSEYAEFFINLPKDWRFDDDALNNWSMRWPLEYLRTAVIDIINTNAIYHGGVIPFLPFNEPIPFFGLMLLSSMKEFEEFETLQVSPGRQIDFYNLFPVHFDEWDWVFDNGARALEEIFLENGIAGAIDINRKSVITES